MCPHSGLRVGTLDIKKTKKSSSQKAEKDLVSRDDITHQPCPRTGSRINPKGNNLKEVFGDF